MLIILFMFGNAEIKHEQNISKEKKGYAVLQSMSDPGGSGS